MAKQSDPEPVSNCADERVDLIELWLCPTSGCKGQLPAYTSDMLIAFPPRCLLCGEIYHLYTTVSK